MSARIDWWNLKTQEECSKMIGKIVYEAYRPARCGKIVDCWPQKTRGGLQAVASIKWLKTGETTNRGLMGMSDLELLVEDHQKKINTHLKRIEEIKKL